MGAICESGDLNAKIESFKKKYPQYHKYDPARILDKNKKKTRNYDMKLIDHIKLFEKYKIEILNTEKDLYKLLFPENGKIDENKEICVKNISSDNELKFLFFINKGDFKSISMKECYILFPKFNMQYFPKFESTTSSFEKIVINGSTLIFENENIKAYEHLEKVKHLDLSYNNLESINENFKKLINLKTLILKRNSITSLPSTLAEMKNLTEVDLTDNKLSKAPNLNFDTLKKLNLNMNRIESFDYTSPISDAPLEYLFLAHNLIRNIPPDLRKFTKLKHVALDGNRIKEINLATINEIKFNVKITLSKNDITNKDQIKDKFKIANDILERDENAAAGNSQKNEEAAEPVTVAVAVAVAEEKKVEESVSIDEAALALKNQFEEFKKRIDDCIKKEKINNPQHVIEHNIALSIDCKYEVFKKSFGTEMKEGQVLPDAGQIRNELTMLKREIICKELLNIIDKKLISEISKFNDYDLKQQLKICYIVYQKFNISKITRNDKEVKVEEKVIFDIFKKIDENNNKNEVKPADGKSVNHSHTGLGNTPSYSKNETGLNNLTFINVLKDILLGSKIRLFFQYISNIDYSLKKYLNIMIQENERSTVIVYLTELRLLIKELQAFYNDYPSDNQEVKYKIKITDTGSLNRIFKDNISQKILYRLGLHVIKTSHNVDYAEFLISYQMAIKYNLVYIFLDKFIKLVKLEKFEVQGYDLK